jgi:hypothetical protein
VDLKRASAQFLLKLSALLLGFCSVAEKTCRVGVGGGDHSLSAPAGAKVAKDTRPATEPTPRNQIKEQDFFP